MMKAIQAVYPKSRLQRCIVRLAAQRIQKHWHARCQNWDLVRSQLQLMFADRVAHCALSL